MATTPSYDPCALLALAKQQLAQYAAGNAVRAVETPQLGRVEFAETNIADLQRLVDRLTAECAAASGDDTTYYTSRRRPLSIESWP